MSNEVAESLREIASNLLAAANRLDGIDVSADAMRSGGMVTYGYGGTAYVPEGFELVQLPEVGWRLTCPCGDHSWTWVHPAVPEQWKIDRAVTEHRRAPLGHGA